MNTSNSEVAPKEIEQLDSFRTYRSYPRYTSSEAGSSNPREFSVGELYGCVCHRPLHELA